MQANTQELDMNIYAERLLDGRSKIHNVAKFVYGDLGNEKNNSTLLLCNMVRDELSAACHSKIDDAVQAIQTCLSPTGKQFLVYTIGKALEKWDYFQPDIGLAVVNLCKKLKW